MNVFQQCWKNWTERTSMSTDQRPGSEHVWINELNQAVFSAFEKKLPSYVKVASVTTPLFTTQSLLVGVVWIRML